MQIIIKMRNGEKFTLEFNHEDTVARLKEMIQTQKQIPIEDQQIIFNGHEMDDQHNFTADKEEDEIQLILQLKSAKANLSDNNIPSFPQSPLLENANNINLHINTNSSAMTDIFNEDDQRNTKPKIKVLAFDVSETLQTIAAHNDSGYGQSHEGDNDLYTYNIMNNNIMNGGKKTAHMLITAQKLGMKIILVTNNGDKLDKGVIPRTLAFFKNYGVMLDPEDYMGPPEVGPADKTPRLEQALINFSISRDELVFFDDSSANYNDAINAGFKSVHVKNADDLHEGIQNALNTDPNYNPEAEKQLSTFFHRYNDKLREDKAAWCGLYGVFFACSNVKEVSMSLRDVVAHAQGTGHRSLQVMKELQWVNEDNELREDIKNLTL